MSFQTFSSFYFVWWTVVQIVTRCVWSEINDAFKIKPYLKKQHLMLPGMFFLNSK